MSSAPFPELTSHHHQPTDTPFDHSTTTPSKLVTNSPVSLPSSSSVTSKAQQVREPLPPVSSQGSPAPGSSGGPSPNAVTPSHNAPQGSIGGGGGPSSRHHSTSAFNPLIYGNDVDSVDVATRIAMVCCLFRQQNFYFQSPRLIVRQIYICLYVCM